MHVRCHAGVMDIIQDVDKMLPFKYNKISRTLEPQRILFKSGSAHLITLRNSVCQRDGGILLRVLFYYVGTVVDNPITGCLVRFMGRKRKTIPIGIFYAFAVAFLTGVPLPCTSFFAFGFSMVSKRYMYGGLCLFRGL